MQVGLHLIGFLFMKFLQEIALQERVEVVDESSLGTEDTRRYILCARAEASGTINLILSALWPISW